MPVRYDPATVGDPASAQITRHVFDTLVTLGDTGELRPGLAEVWENSPDGKTWIFRLRKNVKFHDGTSLSAVAVKFNFDRWRDPNNPYHKSTVDAKLRFPYWDLLGMKDVIADVQSPDDTTVEITLRDPYAPLPQVLTMFPFAIGSAEALKTNVIEFGETKPVGTGPFKFVEAVRGDRVVLEANRDYWGGAPLLDRLVFRPVRSSSVRLSELRAGTFQAIDDPGSEEIRSAVRDPNLQVVTRHPIAVSYLAFNTRKRPLDNVKVRQAIAHAINRDALVAYHYLGLGVPATQFLPRGVPGQVSGDVPYRYNPNRARELLREAGVANGFEMELWHTQISRSYLPLPKQVAEAIAADLKEVGIRADVKTKDWDDFLKDRRGKLDSWTLGWLADNGDPDTFLWELFGPNGVAETGFENQQLRDALEQARKTADLAERERLYRQAGEIVQANVPRLPIAFAAPALVARRNVYGITLRPTGEELFHTAWLAR